jgi:hypothetical protein
MCIVKERRLEADVAGTHRVDIVRRKGWGRKVARHREKDLYSGKLGKGGRRHLTVWGGLLSAVPDYARVRAIIYLTRPRARPESLLSKFLSARLFLMATFHSSELLRRGSTKYLKNS